MEQMKVVRGVEQVTWVGILFHILMAEGKKEWRWVSVRDCGTYSLLACPLV